MFLEYKLKMQTPFLPLPEGISPGKVVISATELKGMARDSFQNLLDISKDEEEIIFGNSGNPGKIIFEDVIYSGETQVSASISLKENREADPEFVRYEEAIPSGVELSGKVHVAPDISMRQINILRHSIYLLELTRVGRIRARGYGKCKVEFPDLKEAGLVFLSYAWEDEEHDEWVHKLADNLVSAGIGVIYDRYDLGFGANIHVYMEDGIANAKKVLLVLTPKYKEKALSRQGGVGYEFSLANAELSEMLAKNPKFLPILRKGDVNGSIPPIYRQYLFCDMRDDSLFDKKFKELYFSILGKKQVTRPEPPWHKGSI